MGAYYETTRFALALDYVYQDWGGRNSVPQLAAGGFEVAYCNTSTVKFGVEWTPNRNDVRNFFKRWHYRVGFNYGDYNRTFGGKRLPQYAVTAGFGIPVRFGGFFDRRGRGVRLPRHARYRSRQCGHHQAELL